MRKPDIVFLVLSPRQEIITHSRGWHALASVFEDWPRGGVTSGKPFVIFHVTIHINGHL